MALVFFSSLAASVAAGGSTGVAAVGSGDASTRPYSRDSSGIDPKIYKAQL